MTHPTYWLKTIFLWILAFVIQSALGQDTLQFSVTTYGQLHATAPTTKSVIYSGKLDLSFYQNHFHTPFYLPQNLVDSTQTNQTVIQWNDSTKVGDSFSNWKYTTQYDSLSRVTSYQYSACMLCSQLPFHYQFHYNQKGQIIEIINAINTQEMFLFEYNKAGNITRFQSYLAGNLRQEIQLL